MVRRCGLLAAFLATLVAAPIAAPAAPVCGPAWSIVPSPNPATDSHLAGVGVLSPTDAWAVGWGQPDGELPNALVEHWDGTAWRVVPSPRVHDSLLFDVVALGPRNVWAVGERSNAKFVARTLVEHWDGVRWSVVPSPNVGAEVNTLGAIDGTPGNLWAVGQDSVGPSQVFGALVEHWDGVRWSVVPSPDVEFGGEALFDVAVVARDDAWAVGTRLFRGAHTSGDTHTLIEHWDGTAWRVVPSPNPGFRSNDLLAIDALSANDIWAVGARSPGKLLSEHVTFALHWDGGAWTPVPTPTPSLPKTAALGGVVALAPDDVYAVGGVADSHSSPRIIVTRPIVEHWDGSAWTRMKTPAGLHKRGGFGRGLASVDAVPGRVIAVGTAAQTTLVEQLCPAS